MDNIYYDCDQDINFIDNGVGPKRPRKQPIQFRRSTSKRFKEKNPYLLNGEPAYEYDTKKLKIGDGISRYNDLPYIGSNDDTTYEFLDGTNSFKVIKNGSETQIVNVTPSVPLATETSDGLMSKEDKYKLDNISEDEINKIDNILLNNIFVPIDEEKSAIINISEGSDNGTISVNGQDVFIHGLKSAAFNDGSEYEESGKAEEVYNSLISYTEEEIVANFADY